MRREVEEPFVEEDKGDTMDKEEVVDALETERRRRPGSFGPAGDGVRRYLEVALGGPGPTPMAVSMASLEYIWELLWSL